MFLLSAGLGIAKGIAGFAQGQAAASAANKAAIEQYKHRIKIVQNQNAAQNQIYATKLGQYDLGMRAADRAAARAYGAEQYNQISRYKQANVTNMALNRAFAKSGGLAAASGKEGRSADRLDLNAQRSFVRNQAMTTANLLAADEASAMKMMGIQDQLQGERNRLYSQVAIAPQQPMMPLAPAMRSGPSPIGAALNIGSSLLGSYNQFQSLQAPDVGDIGGFGFTEPTAAPDFSYTAPTPLTSGINFFGN